MKQQQQNICLHQTLGTLGRKVRPLLRKWGCSLVRMRSRRSLQVCVTGSLSATSEIWILTLSGIYVLPEGESSMFWAHGHRLAVKQSFKVGPPHRRSLGAPESPELLSTRHLEWLRRRGVGIRRSLLGSCMCLHSDTDTYSSALSAAVHS